MEMTRQKLAHLQHQINGFPFLLSVPHQQNNFRQEKDSIRSHLSSIHFSSNSEIFPSRFVFSYFQTSDSSNFLFGGFSKSSLNNWRRMKSPLPNSFSICFSDLHGLDCHSRNLQWRRCRSWSSPFPYPLTFKKRSIDTQDNFVPFPLWTRLLSHTRELSRLDQFTLPLISHLISKVESAGGSKNIRITIKK